MKTKHRFVCLTLALVCLTSHALERLFPQNAKRGVLSMRDYPDYVAMNGKARRLSPGAWIRNENNTIDLPGSLIGREFVVNYTETIEGDIDRVWILSAEEARKPAPSKAQGAPQEDQRMFLIE